MPDDEQILKKRLEELADRAAAKGIYTYSGFLTEAEQGVLRGIRPAPPYSLEGGCGSAERMLARFGETGYEEAPPICCLRIAPTAPKFADGLSHRDFLGALMSLGIRRETLGDIIIQDNIGYLFCLESIAEYIVQQLGQVAHTTVTVSCEKEPPSVTGELPPIKQVVVASERLDALVAAVYMLSRAESQKLFSQGRVFVNGREELNDSHRTAPGDKISVRGLGRFIYEGVERETRRGRLRAGVRVFR